MSNMSMIEAIRSAHEIAMERDDRVVVFGEDVGYFGGVFRCTQGLQEKFGKDRCFDSPISEAGIVGADHVSTDAADRVTYSVDFWPKFSLFLLELSGQRATLIPI